MIKKKRSNLQMISNVYPVDVTGDLIDLKANSQFTSRITNRNALRLLVEMINPQQNYNDIRVANRPKAEGLLDWQVTILRTPVTCSLSPSGEIPWGLQIVDGKINYICKCDFRSCPEFEKCRPEAV